MASGIADAGFRPVVIAVEGLMGLVEVHGGFLEAVGVLVAAGAEGKEDGDGGKDHGHGFKGKTFSHGCCF